MRRAYVTTTKAARLVGTVSPSTILRAVRAGKFSGYRTPGGHWRIKKDSMLAFFTPGKGLR